LKNYKILFFELVEKIKFIMLLDSLMLARRINYFGKDAKEGSSDNL